MGKNAEDRGKERIRGGKEGREEEGNQSGGEGREIIDKTRCQVAFLKPKKLKANAFLKLESNNVCGLTFLHSNFWFQKEGDKVFSR